MDKVRYKEGYKYQLVEPYSYQTDIKGYNIDHDWIRLEPNGTLTAQAGYAWDGASGPTVDTKSSMRGSLIHDCLYQLMGMDSRMLVYRTYADDLLYKICCEDGMHPFRAYLWRKVVNWFGEEAAEQGDKILEAP